MCADSHIHMLQIPNVPATFLKTIFRFFWNIIFLAAK